MDKAELVEEVAGQTGLIKKVAREAVDAMISAVTGSQKRNEKVTLIGLGTFKSIERKARKGVNPQTGRVINMPVKKVPKFRPGRELKSKVK
jgi:DNA-binding protein HU-beta